MIRTIKLLSAVSALTVATIAVTPAFAAGTTAGSSITNNVSVAFQVGGVSQTASTDSDSFTVDRKVNLTVTETNTTTVSVSPNQANVAAAFTVTNNSNAPIDIGLAATQQAGGAGAHSNTDNFNLTGLAIYRDVNNNGLYDSGTDTALSYADELAADASVNVIVVGTVPISQVTGDVAAVTLTGTAQEAGTSGTAGAAITATSGANTAGVDTVLADAAGETGDVAYDGKHSDKDDFTVLAAAITANKYSTIISDPVNGTTNPKLIPGAVVEYCIAVSNAAGGATATNVGVSDTIPLTTTYLSSYGIFENATVTGSGATATCNLDGTAGGGFASGTVSGSLGSIAAGTAKGVRFRVTIN